jgi:hypothetical protein
MAADFDRQHRAKKAHTAEINTVARIPSNSHRFRLAVDRHAVNRRHHLTKSGDNVPHVI